MKVIYLFLAISVLFANCNSGSKTPEASEPTTEVQNPPTTPPSKGTMVESTRQIPEAPVDDANVDYPKLAESICQCGAAHRGTDSGHKGMVDVTAEDKEYQKEVDCSIAAKNAMTKGELSRQKLIGKLKEICPDLPGKIVMRVMMALGN